MTAEHNDGEQNAAISKAQPQPAKLDLPALADALQVAPTRRTDEHFGTGYSFAVGEAGQTELQLYRTAIRLTMGDRQLALPRTEAQISNEGVIFADEHGSLAVAPSGKVVFQFLPDKPTPEATPPSHHAITVEPVAPVASTTTEQPNAKEKVKSERHVGQMGKVSRHTTKAGKLVAEFELAVPDPERPGQPFFLKFAAFNDMAQELLDTYRPGDEVIAVGVPHELQRSNGKGHHWTERQLYLVRPPKRTTS